MTRLADKFADRLLEMRKKVRRAGPGKYVAQCPGHEDRAESLSVSTGDDGRLLLHCFAGCPWETIAQAAGWEVKDCFLPKDAPIVRQNGLAPKPPKAWPTNEAAIEAARRGIEYGVGRDVAEARETLLDAAADPRQRAAAERTIQKRGDVAEAGRWEYENGQVVRFNLPTVPGEKTEKTFRPFHPVPAGWAMGDPAGKWALYGKAEILAAVKA